jgi:menaquinone-specific isochorismate synthase
VSGVTACRLRDAGQSLGRELRRQRSSRRALSVTVPFPALPVEALLSLLAEGEACGWLPPDGPGLFGWGAAAVSDGDDGSPRSRSLEATAPAGGEPVGPLWLGGAPFDPARLGGDPWGGFEGARFTLPRWLYRRDPEGPASLTLFLTEDDEPGARDRALESELPAWLDLPERARGWRRPETAALAPEAGPTAPDGWDELVGKALAAIGDGALDKVVLARRREIRDVRPVDPGPLLAALEAQAPASTRFAFRAGGATFLGASPERLLLRRGRRIRTEAMAGTRALSPGADPDALGRELLASAKDRAEHEWTRRGLIESLAELAEHLDAPERPGIRRLRHVMHLVTPIEAELSEDLPLLALARRIHPTPAVGGYPTQAALAWLREHEPIRRGWFAGPVGWFDGEGGGELRVALRSGMVRGPSVHAFAGAGIVAGSVPDTESGEIRAKLRPLLAALGCEA